MKNHEKPPAQRDRFIQTARELECNEDEERFNENLRWVVTSGPPDRQSNGS